MATSVDAITKVDSKEIARVAEQDFSAEEIRSARELRVQLEGELAAARRRQRDLEACFMRVGRALQEVSEKQYYRLYGFPRFGEFMKYIEEKYNRKAAQLYGYKGVSEQLSGIVSDVDLEKMGSEKAKVLAKIRRQTGRVLDAEIVEAAKDPKKTVSSVRAIAAERKLLAAGEKPEGSWYDLGGFMATKDERAEINRALECAKRVDPVISKEWPAWQQNKECWLRMCREFLATYEAAVQEGKV